MSGVRPSITDWVPSSQRHTCIRATDFFGSILSHNLKKEKNVRIIKIGQSEPYTFL